MSYGRAILGDNQFLGVNHASQAKASELFEKYKDPQEIISIIASAYETGVRDFMFTTHDRYDPVFDEIRRSNLFPEMHYSPCIPYAHKYWNQLSYKSMPKLFASTLLQANPAAVIPAGVGLLFGQPGALIHLLLKIEMLMCKGLPVRGVFLQNAAFDMLMAIEAHKELEAFAETTMLRLGVLPGFITMNHPKAVEVLCDRIGLETPWTCANYNLSGFRTNPSKAAVEASFKTRRTRNIAMSVFSSGSASAEDSLEFVISKSGESGGVDAIVFGSSSANHIRSNAETILTGM